MSCPSVLNKLAAGCRWSPTPIVICYAIAALTGDFNVDGHRADIVILKAARAHAAYEGRLSITDRDVLLAAELALPHRMKRQPFQEAGLEQSQLEDKLRRAHRKKQAAQAEASEDPRRRRWRTPQKSAEGSEIGRR